MVMASGANFGLGRTVPHLLGIATGVLFIMALVGVGLMALLDAVPALRPVLDVLSTAYLLSLAWKIARATARHPRAARTRASFRRAGCMRSRARGCGRSISDPHS